MSFWRLLKNLPFESEEHAKAVGLIRVTVNKCRDYLRASMKEKSATRREYRRYILPSRTRTFCSIAKVAASRQDDRLSVLFRGLQRKRDRNIGRENSQRRSDPPDEGERGVERIVRGGVTMDENKYREEMSKVQMSEQKKSEMIQAQYLLLEPQRTKPPCALRAKKCLAARRGGRLP